MKFTSYIIEQFFQLQRESEEKSGYYGKLLRLAYTIVEAEKIGEKNKAIVKKLNWVRDNTSPKLMYPLARAENVLKLYTKDEKRNDGDVPILIKRKDGTEVRIPLVRFKEALADAAIEITRAFSMVARRYNVDVATRNDGGENNF